VIAWFAGTHPDTISHATKAIHPLLAQHQIKLPPASAPLRTPTDLIRHASAAGITLPPELKQAC
jgi:hypothetical protein